MTNVSVSFMSESAIVVDSGYLELEDVVIDNCDVPCFIVESKESLVMKGYVEINGTEVDLSNMEDYIFFSVDEDQTGPAVYDWEKVALCPQKDSKIICNFSNTTLVSK